MVGMGGMIVLNTVNSEHTEHLCQLQHLYNTVFIYQYKDNTDNVICGEHTQFQVNYN